MSRYSFQDQLKKTLDQYPPFEFNGKRITIEALFGKDQKFTKYMRQTKVFNPFSPKISNKQNEERRSKSITDIRLLEMDYQLLNKRGRKSMQQKKLSFLAPFKNAVEKLRNQKRELYTRRKSCYGQLFGDINLKQTISIPTIIEMHKRVDGKEFALNSFTDLLRKNQKQFTQRTSISKRLSKQASLIEYDNMERPPTSKTTRESKIFVVKKKNSLISEKSKYIEGQQLRLFHFMNDFQSRHKFQTIFNNNINKRTYVNSKICKTETFSTQQFMSLSNRNTTYERPYQQQNKLLYKLIKSEHKYRSNHTTKIPIGEFVC